MIKHIGLAIHDPSEITNFYQNVLGLTIEKEFTLTKDLNQKLFGFYEEVPVTRMSNNNMILEIFVTTLPSTNSYAHICVEVENRESLIEKVKMNNYQCTVIKRNSHPLVFIQDKFGNNFEIMKKNNHD